MTKNQIYLRKQLLARIHSSSKYKEIKQNEAWEDWLYHRFKVTSSALLSITELNLVLDILLKLKKDEIDIKPDYLGRNLVKNANLNKTTKEKVVKKITPNQYKYIIELAKTLNFSSKQLTMFAMKQTRRILIRLDQLEDLKLNDARKVIIGLEEVIKYKHKKQ